MNRCSIFLLGIINRRFRKYSIHKSAKINGRIRYYGWGEIIISNGARLNSGLKYNPIGGDDRISIFSGIDASVVLGNNFEGSNFTICAWKSVIIGDGVRIGGGVKIYDTDFHEIPKGSHTEIKVSPVYIGKNVFIGAHAIILKGVCIGDNSVIGAGSVVTKNIGDNEVWAGSPARFIRKI